MPSSNWKKIKYDEDESGMFTFGTVQFPDRHHRLNHRARVESSERSSSNTRRWTLIGKPWDVKENVQWPSHVFFRFLLTERVTNQDKYYFRDHPSSSSLDRLLHLWPSLDCHLEFANDVLFIHRNLLIDYDWYWHIKSDHLLSLSFIAHRTRRVDRLWHE